MMVRFLKNARQVLAAGWILAGAAGIQAADGTASKIPCPDSEVARYDAFRVTEPMVIDGRLDEAAWRQAPRSPRFVDLISGGPAIHDTRAMVLWDDQYLYVGYEIEEPLVRATLKHQNDPIYTENDVECFIAGRDAYYEFEINALNTCYEAFFIWNDSFESGGFAQAPEFQRSRLQPFNGVGFQQHPRGGRLGNFQWIFPGRKTAVSVDGSLNDDRDRDRGWRVELAFPWSGLAWLAKADQRSLPPKDGDVWRMDFSRFNTYKAAVPARDSGGWVWSRHGVWDSHIPECFTRVRFRTNGIPNRPPTPAGR